MSFLGVGYGVLARDGFPAALEGAALVNHGGAETL